MVDKGISFAGDGEKDVTINKSGTMPGNMASSSEKVIDFAGDGASEVSHANEPTHGGKTVSGEGPIQFVD